MAAAAVRGGPPRHYPPGVVFHAPHCIEGGNAIAVPVGSAFDTHPNHMFDACFAGLIPPFLAEDAEALAGIMPYISVETISYHQHAYVPSPPRGSRMPQLFDAIRPLCRICRGTHQGEA